MIKIEFRKISFADGVEHLQGKKIIPKPDNYTFTFTPYPDCCAWNPTITFFDDGSCMTTVSDWYKGYYGEIDANDPLFYLGWWKKNEC